MTTVINVRGRSRAELEADPNFAYVGRAVPRSGWKASPWGNPFKVGMTGPEVQEIFTRLWNSRQIDRPIQMATGEGMRLMPNAVVATYQLLVKASPSLRERLPELRDKTLGCWCCDWLGHGEPSAPCHAVVLARLADSMEDPANG